MFHEPADNAQVKDLAVAYKTRLGVWMFVVYAGVYACFVALNLIDPSLMELPVLLGLNLAVVYGLGLIVVALVMAVIYNRMCLVEEKRLEQRSHDKQEA